MGLTSLLCLLLLSLCLVSVAVSAGRPSPAFVTSVRQTSAFTFDVTVRPPKYLATEYVTESGPDLDVVSLIDGVTEHADNANGNHNNGRENSTATQLRTIEYKLYVVDPNDSSNVLPIPSSCWIMKTDTSIELDVTILCSDISGLVGKNTTSPTETIAITTNASQVTGENKNNSTLITAEPIEPIIASEAASSEAPSISNFQWSWSTRSNADSKCPLPLVDNHFRFSLGITVQQHQVQSLMTWLPYSKMKIMSASEMHTLSVEPVDSFLQHPSSSTPVNAWMVVTSLLLPVCVTLAITVVVLYRRQHQYQHGGEVKKVPTETETNIYQVNAIHAHVVEMTSTPSSTKVHPRV